MSIRELEYPFDGDYLLRKKRALRRQLLADEAVNAARTAKKIAILGGSTTSDLKSMLELFLLNYGIAPTFYESEYNRYYEDGAFPNPALEEFAPDFIYIHTSSRNLTDADLPSLSDTREQADAKLAAVRAKFEGLWAHLEQTYHAVILQNNFEPPLYRLLGNRDISDYRGAGNFIARLNLIFSEYADTHPNFYIHDLSYEAADYGLQKWADPTYWYMYKYAMCLSAIPGSAFQVANLIKSALGKNKKVLNLDLDNTLWGGIVGDDGADRLEIGQETPTAQSYAAFQSYLKKQKEIGVLLTVNSKNEEDAALSGLARPDSVLKREDFTAFKANWDPKSLNLQRTAGELNLLPESFVFVDDNPAEREIIRQQLPSVSVPELERPEDAIRLLDRSGFFEVTAFSEEDRRRAEMYESNLLRQQAESSFADYNDYLLSLQMQAEIRPFVPEYLARIAQLTNKTNQFNLTTKRYSQAEMEAIAADPSFLTLYGKLEDRFGDNGVVSVILGKKSADTLDLELWLMSCRVLKRDMEYAMLDELVANCKASDIHVIRGYYIPTAKNAMVREFYAQMGFEKVREAQDGSTEWIFRIPDTYEPKNHVIRVGGPA